MRLSTPVMFVLVTCAFGCLDAPDVGPAAYSAHVLPPGSEVRPLERNMDAKTKLDLNDMVMAMVPLRSGYSGGEPVEYWDLGQSPTSGEPMWIFTAPGDPPVPVDHPPLIDSIPADSAYSPIRLLYRVDVTSRWRGERIPSLRALEDALELGLIEDPKPLDAFDSCAVTIEDVRLEVGGGAPPIAPTEAYYRDRKVFHFCTANFAGGPYPLNKGAIVFGNVYLLRQENQVVALDEAALKTDMTMDGDQLDTNAIYDARPGDMSYSPVWKSFDLVVQPTYTFGAVKDVAQLFEKKPWGNSAILGGPVVEWKDTTLVLNRPMRPRTP